MKIPHSQLSQTLVESSKHNPILEMSYNNQMLRQIVPTLLSVNVVTVLTMGRILN